MRIISAKGEFFAPALSAQLNINNVLLLEAGEMTSPITLPGTAHNLALIDNSHRPDAYFKPLTDLDVILIDGLVHCKCNLGIHSANEEDGISCTLYLDTGGFYSRMMDVKLSSLDLGSMTAPTPSLTQTQKVQYLIGVLKSKWAFPFPGDDDVFRFFPLLTSQEYTWIKRNINASIDASGVNVTSKLVINNFESETELPFPNVWESFSLNVFEGERLQKIVMDNSNITLPIGYGMSPFLTVKYVLSKIFDGYDFDYTQITDFFPEFNMDVVANTVADAICTGTIHFNQLVPDIDVKQFLAELEKRYAGKFIVSENLKKVVFITYDSALNADPDVDLTPYLVSIPKLGSPEFEKNIVKYNTDQNTVIDSKIKTTLLEFDFFTLQSLPFKKMFGTIADHGYTNLTLRLIDAGEIYHKNSTLQVDGKFVTETPSDNTSLKIINANMYNNSKFTSQGQNIYMTAESPPWDYMIGTQCYHPNLKPKYLKYINFKLNSNVPISAKMKLPEGILHGLKLHIPKVLKGQLVLIESVQYVLGDSTTQNVTFRTIRPFADR